MFSGMFRLRAEVVSSGAVTERRPPGPKTAFNAVAVLPNGRLRPPRPSRKDRLDATDWTFVANPLVQLNRGPQRRCSVGVVAPRPGWRCRALRRWIVYGGGLLALLAGAALVANWRSSPSPRASVVATIVLTGGSCRTHKAECEELAHGGTLVIFGPEHQGDANFPQHRIPAEWRNHAHQRPASAGGLQPHLLHPASVERPRARLRHKPGGRVLQGR
jgi:hypothetical protein